MHARTIRINTLVIFEILRIFTTRHDHPYMLGSRIRLWPIRSASAISLVHPRGNTDKRAYQHDPYLTQKQALLTRIDILMEKIEIWNGIFRERVGMISASQIWGVAKFERRYNVQQHQLAMARSKLLSSASKQQRTLWVIDEVALHRVVPLALVRPP